MSLALTDGTTVQLFPLHVGPVEDGVHEVGRAEVGEFIALPGEGVALLGWFADGLPINEVRRRFSDRYGVEPDLGEFIGSLDSLGFVQAIDGRSRFRPAADNVVPADRIGNWRLFATLPEQRVAWLLSRPLRVVYWTIWLAVPAITLARMDLVPHPEDAVAYSGAFINLVVLFTVGWGLVFLHEVAHVLAARARGCSTALSLGRRLYILVAQTDMSGIRTIPRSQRYAPYLAGITFHLAVLLLCFAFKLAGMGGRLPHLIALMAIIQLMFQFAIFLRTDIYYVLVNWLRLGNLNQDVRFTLMNLWRRLLKKQPYRDLSVIPERERRIVRWYLPAYVLGVLVAIANLAFLVVPSLAALVGQAVEGVIGDSDRWSTLDGVAFIGFALLNVGTPLLILLKEIRAKRVTT